MYVITFNNLVIITRPWYAVFATKKYRAERELRGRRDWSQYYRNIGSLVRYVCHVWSHKVYCSMKMKARQKVWDLMAQH